MVDKPWVKWFMRIACFVMTVNMLMTAASACLVPGMNRLVYTCSGEDACIIQLDFENRQVRYMKYTSAYDNRWMVGEMTDFMVIRLKFAAAVAAAPMWFENYSGTEDVEADAWGVDMYFGDRIKTCQGNGDAPFSHKILISKIMRIAQLFPEDNTESRQIPGNVATADV